MESRIGRHWQEQLEHAAWEHRFLAAKYLATEPGKHEFDGLSGRDRGVLGRRLTALLDDMDSRVRTQAAAALGRLHITAAKDALVAALADPNEWVRVQVGEALSSVGDAKTAQVVAGHLEAEEESHVRATLVKTLGIIGDEKMLPVLALYLEDADSRVRANDVEAVAKLNVGKAALKKALLRVSDDPSNRVRANTAMALLSIGEKKGQEMLRDMIASKDEYMRASASYALGELRETGDRAVILKLLEDTSWLVRKNAVQALVKHGRKAIEGVIATLRSKNSMARLGALEVISRLRAVDARSAVIDLLEDEAGDVRGKAEETLDALDGY
ncbi:MAG: HEAT repeat domain-containing protein [Candidatus Ozemobacteraceae bacterium]